MDKYDEMPEGWRIDSTWGTPEHGYQPICNGISSINGGQRALLRVKDVVIPAQETPSYDPIKEAIAAPKETDEQKKERAIKTNQLARELFKQKLAQEVIFDLSVCKIEGWDHKQYIAELKTLIDGIAESVMNGARA